MAYTAGTLTSLGSALGFTLYHHDAGDDSIATVITAGYFNNTDDLINLVVGDEIISVCTDGTVKHKVSSISSGAVTTVVDDQVINVDTGLTTANLPATGLSWLSGYTAAKTFTLDTPFKGAVKRIFSAVTGFTMTVNIGDTVATFDGTNRNLAFDAAGETVTLVGQSATRWLIAVNTGTVAAS